MAGKSAILRFAQDIVSGGLCSLSVERSNDVFDCVSGYLRPDRHFFAALPAPSRRSDRAMDQRLKSQNAYLAGLFAAAILCRQETTARSDRSDGGRDVRIRAAR